MSSGMSAPIGRTIGPQTSGLGTGDVTVDVNVASATFTIYGPEPFGTNGVTTGTGDNTYSGVDAGGYHVVFDAVSGYATPAVAYGVLEDGSTLTLTGTYLSEGTGIGNLGGLLNETYTHKRPSRADDGNGGFDTTLSTVGTLAGSGFSSSSNEVTQAGNRVGDITETIYVGPSESIRRNDVLIDSDSRAFRIKSIERPSRAVYQKLICVETQGET